MDLLTLVNVTAVAALIVGFLLGWIIGRRAKTVTTTRDAARDAAYRENAQVDFEAVRDKANQIVRLANEIATRATSAHDTVLDPHRDIEQQPQLGGAITTGRFHPGAELENKSSLRSAVRGNIATEIVNASGSYVGRVEADGVVNNSSGSYMGRVDLEGVVNNSSGSYRGRVNSDGVVNNASGTYVGRAKADGTIDNASGAYMGRGNPPNILHQGAALLLLPLG